MIYSWGYGCAAPSTPTFNPPASKMPGAKCPLMQVPGPTLNVTEGKRLSSTQNNLPAAAVIPPILFPAPVTATGEYPAC